MYDPKRSVRKETPHYQMQVKFYPADTIVERCIGHADLILANAILIRGISVLKEENSGKLSLRFPTYGIRKESYVLPENKDIYKQMVYVTRKAVKDNSLHTYEVDGIKELSLFVTVDSLYTPVSDALFDLHIKGFCVLKGIIARSTYILMKDKWCTSVSLPSLSEFSGPDGHLTAFAVFQGLTVPDTTIINDKAGVDCASLIEELVLKEHALQQIEVGETLRQL